MKNKHAFLFALIGGIILIIQGVTGSIGFFAYILLLGVEFAELVPLLNAIVWILTIIALSGGVGAIVGGYLLTTQRIGTGKFIIGIAVGMGLISLIITLIQLVWFSGATAAWDFLVISSQSLSFIGVILTILARRTIRSE